MNEKDVLLREKELILASASPRRQQLMTEHGLRFSVLVSDVDESVECPLSPQEYVLCIARRKAVAATEIALQRALVRAGKTLIIAADTVVALGDTIYGKPDSPAGAVSMLQTLQGRVHDVYTAICVVRFEPVGAGQPVYSTDVCRTGVKLRTLDEQTILDYVRSGEPMDKAGGYAIQGAAGRFVECVDGDYENVVGMSVARLMDML